MATVFVGADIVLSLIGGITLELFSRRAMQTLFRRFFEHIVFQVCSALCQTRHR